MATKQQQAAVVGLGLMAVCIAGYILGPPLYWHLKEGFVAVARSSPNCSPCLCDCSSQPLLSIPQGLSNASFTDCAKHDPEVTEDAEKNFAELLKEELQLRETEALENQRRADIVLLEAKKMTSQYQKEADKCNSGMETCEEAREKSEAALVAQKKLTAMWELRARQRGWKDEVAKSNTHSQGNVQSTNPQVLQAQVFLALVSIGKGEVSEAEDQQDQKQAQQEEYMDVEEGNSNGITIKEGKIKEYGLPSNTLDESYACNEM